MQAPARATNIVAKLVNMTFVVLLVVVDIFDTRLRGGAGVQGVGFGTADWLRQDG